MCKQCWIDHGRPHQLPPNTGDIIELINELYARPDAAAGGPLHALLDDFNLDCPEPWRDAEWLPGTIRLADQIADLMRPLSDNQRGAVIAEREGWITPRPPAFCTHRNPDHDTPEPVTYQIVWTTNPDAVTWACATHAERILRYQNSVGVHVELRHLLTDTH